MARSTQSAKSLAPVARHTRRNLVRATLGRRKLGKRERNVVIDRAESINEGVRGSYYTPIAIKSFNGRDSHQDHDGRTYEDACWQSFDDNLFRLHNTVKASDRSEARAAYIQELKELLEMEVRDAYSVLAEQRPGSSEHKKMKHRCRRYVAGRHQLLELMKQGDGAILAAIDDKVIIFQEGHCVNRFEFRKLYGW